MDANKQFVNILRMVECTIRAPVELIEFNPFHLVGKSLSDLN